MIINIRVVDEAVKQMGDVLHDYFSCKHIGRCERCENFIGCECLVVLRDACYGNKDVSNYICEVTIDEE